MMSPVIFVVNRKGKAFCQHTLVGTEIDGMDAGVDQQRIYVGEQGVDEVSTQAVFLFFVESGAADQVL